MWVFATTTLIGNLVVLIVKYKTKTKSNIQKVQIILIGNLSFADLLMGVYMSFIVIADLVYGDKYYMHSDYWRESLLCKIAKFLVVLSSETSLFLIVLITCDRYLCLVFPLRPSLHFGRLSAIISVFAIWIITIGLNLTTSIVAGEDTGIYVLSDVCIGIPLIRRISRFVDVESGITSSIHGQEFSTEKATAFDVLYLPIIIFIGINLFLLFVMIILYIVIFCAIIRSGKVSSSKRVKEHIFVAMRMAIIVGTNCLCWVPIITMVFCFKWDLSHFLLNFITGQRCFSYP